MAHIRFSDAATTLVPARCAPSDLVGDAVCIVGDLLAGSIQVGRADPFQIVRMPAVGILVAKQDATHGSVAILGLQELAGFSPGARLFVGQDGRPTVTPMVPARTQPMFVQSLGQAMDSGHVFVLPSRDMIRVGPP